MKEKELKTRLTKAELAELRMAKREAKKAAKEAVKEAKKAAAEGKKTELPAEAWKPEAPEETREDSPRS